LASVDKRAGSWRAQVRREGRSLTKTFWMKSDAEAWARDVERSIDNDIDPSSTRITTKDTFGSLIDLHIDDLQQYGKPLRRSKAHVLRWLKLELGSEQVSCLTRGRLIRCGRERAAEGAGPATLAIDISFIGTVLTHAAALHGLQVNTEAVRLGTPRERQTRRYPAAPCRLASRSAHSAARRGSSRQRRGRCRRDRRMGPMHQHALDALPSLSREDRQPLSLAEMA
jgi:hypothetical protein